MNHNLLLVVDIDCRCQCDEDVDLLGDGGQRRKAGKGLSCALLQRNRVSNTWSRKAAGRKYLRMSDVGKRLISGSIENIIDKSREIEEGHCTTTAVTSMKR